jgi:predicted enzyme related to lactoylglutathione lyase
MSHPVVHAEIRSSDPDATRAFFGELLGWTVDPEESGYGIIRNQGALNGGIRPPQDGEPTHWLVYFTAESLDDTIEKIKDAGGSVITGPLATPVGRVAAVSDPQGAAFALFEGPTDD